MILKILLGLASFMAIHSLTMMHMCHVGLKCDNSSEMTSECLEMIYARYRRRQRIHRYHLIGYAVSSALILIAMLILWR